MPKYCFSHSRGRKTPRFLFFYWNSGDVCANLVRIRKNKGNKMAKKQNITESSEAVAKRFVREKKLMMADYFDILENMDKRQEYSRKLKTNPEFVKIDAEHDMRLIRQKERNEKKEKAIRDFIFILILSVFIAGGVGVYNYQNNTVFAESKAQGMDNNSSLIIVISVFMGIFVGWVFSDRPTKKHWNTKNASEFYNRLVIRYFDKLRAENPMISEEGLRTYNPDLSRAIYALMSANLSKQDMAKLDNLALSVASELDGNSFGENLKDIDEKMAAAVKIVNKALSKRPELCQIIQNAYMGQIPNTFFLENIKNRGMSR